MAFTEKKLWQGTPVAGLVVNPTAAPTLTTATTGGSLAGGQTLYVKYTWVTALGETQASPEASIAVPAGTSTNTITATIPSLPTGASSANIYISSTAGTETKQGNTTSTSYTQSATLAAGSALPISNTANLAYNVPTNVSTIVKSIVLNNTTNTGATLTMYLVPNGSSPATGNQFLSAFTVSPGSSNGMSGIDDHIVLNAGDTIQFFQGTASAVNVIISGVEVQ